MQVYQRKSKVTYLPAEIPRNTLLINQQEHSNLVYFNDTDDTSGSLLKSERWSIDPATRSLSFSDFGSLQGCHEPNDIYQVGVAYLP